jgi:hypothetical protein
MATWVDGKCGWLLCNRIRIVRSSALVGPFKNIIASFGVLWSQFHLCDRVSITITDHQNVPKHLLPTPEQTTLQSAYGFSLGFLIDLFAVAVHTRLATSSAVKVPAALFCTATSFWTVGLSKLVYAHKLWCSLLRPRYSLWVQHRALLPGGFVQAWSFRAV